MHRDIALSTSVISARMSDMVHVTSKSVLQIMRKFNNLSFYHDLDLCKKSNSSLLAQPSMRRHNDVIMMS